MIRQQLESKRHGLMQKINQVGPWIEGTLVATSRYCGKEACACHQGGSKHPVLFVTWKEDGKTVSLYIPRKLESQVQVWASNYQKLKGFIRALSDVQKQIVRLRE